MGMGTHPKQKAIVVADSDQKTLVSIVKNLKKQGYSNIKIAEEGKKFKKIIRPFYHEPENIGLIIINEELPGCNVAELSLTLSSNESGALVPFIIFTTKNNHNRLNDLDPNAGGLIHYMDLPINYSELILVVNFQMRIKQERLLRFRQEDRLINELAERKVVDARLKYLVVHDELTGLLNRQNFERRLKLVLNRNNRLHLKGALLFIDIDMFSHINELEGFDVGDRLLVEIVSIIRKHINSDDLFARIGSDEFCLYLDHRPPNEIKRIAESIKNEIYDSRLFIGDSCYNTSVSIGISNQTTRKAIYHPGEVISRARQACRLAKENGRNLVKEYNEKHTKIRQRHKDIYWVPLIRNALIEKKLFLVFQPIVDLGNGQITHYEALIRMKGLSGEIISPKDFIPVAERIGLIHRIDLWVIEQAIEFLAKLPTYQSNVTLSINLSSVAFQESSLLPTIKEKLELSWVDAKRITFEITETLAVDKVEQTRELINNIRSFGCKFALDDFGTGFCSFNYLKSFPVDYIKIDGQFIQNLVNDETDQVLVKSIVEVAKKLGKKTIAEFVESSEVVEMLIDLGVDYGQGYVFGEPDQQLLSEKTVNLSEIISNPRTNKVNKTRLLDE